MLGFGGGYGYLKGMHTQFRVGNLVNFYKGFGGTLTENYTLLEMDMSAISAGIDKVEGVPVTLNWKIKFYHHSGDAIPLDTVRYVHELQNYYFKLFGKELGSA